MISARTKAAPAAAKRRGVKLGGDRGARLTARARAAGRAAVQERARKAGRWITFHYRAPRSVITAWAASVGGLILQWHQPKKRPRRHSRTRRASASSRNARPQLLVRCTRMVSIPARTLRAGAVLAPEFIARNPVRDQFTALAFSEHGYPPPGKIPPCENTPLIQSLFREHALSGYAPHIGNVRAALGWALLDHGDAAVGSRVVPSIIMKSSGQSFMECHRLCQPMKFDRGKCIPATLPDRIARMYLDMVGEWEHLKCPSRRGQIGCFSSSHLRRAGSALALGSRTIMRWCT
jgi:hypothetical protein